jgi:hypothetical protein
VKIQTGLLAKSQKLYCYIMPPATESWLQPTQPTGYTADVVRIVKMSEGDSQSSFKITMKIINLPEFLP